MQIFRNKYFFPASLSVTLHVLVLTVAIVHPFKPSSELKTAKPEEKVVFLEVMSPPPEQTAPAQRPAAIDPAPAQAAMPAPAIRGPQETAVAPLTTAHTAAFMEAPPAPTAQEWTLAAGYALKNSKRYRHTWGQAIRSRMGTAVEGPDQGVVRFRIEIAPDGTLVRLETLWTTSVKAEELARKAVENMPPLPPTPTGKPLIFEKTISFQPFAADDSPIYKNDCLPDPPAFSNPFAWDGKSPQGRAVPATPEKLDPQALEECLKQLPQDSIESESAHDQRQLKQWGSGKLAR